MSFRVAPTERDDLVEMICAVAGDRLTMSWGLIEVKRDPKDRVLSFQRHTDNDYFTDIMATEKVFYHFLRLFAEQSLHVIH